MNTPSFQNFSDFYLFYRSQHQHPVCRYLHVIGVLTVLLLGGYWLIQGWWLRLLWLPVIGYSFSWTGHFGFEKNKPATFGYPWFSLLGDFRMCWDVLTGRW